MATARSKLEILIDVLFGNSKREMGAIEKGLNSLTFRFNQAYEAGQKIAEQAKKAYEFGKAGAQLEMTENRFDRLAKSIGTTGDALIKDLKPAMGGMLSESQMMASATDLMALGLVKSHDEAIRLSRVAGQLNMNMNQLVLTLTNQTTMRFDALGVSVDGFKDKVKDLENQGYSTQDAFSEAFLRQAEQQLTRVGSVVNEDIAVFGRFEASIGDLTDTMKRSVNEGIQPTLEAWTDFFNDSVAFEKSQTRIKAAMDAGNISMERGKKLLDDLRWRRINDAQAMAVVDWHFEQIEKSTSSYDKALLNFNNTQDETIDKFDDMSDSAKELEEQQGRLQNALGMLNDFVGGKLGETTEDFMEQQDELAIKMGEVRKEMSKLEEKDMLTPEQAEQLETLQAEYDDLKLQYGENADEHDEATKRIMFNILTQQAAIDGLSQNEVIALSRVAEQWGIIDEETANYTLAASGYFADLAAGLAGPADILDYIEKWMNRMKDRRINLYVDVNTNSNLQSPGGGFVDPGTGSVYGGSDTQHGGSFLIPPGYHENFGVGRASSGERVQVTPRQGNTYNQTWNVYSNGGKQPFERDYNMQRALAN